MLPFFGKTVRKLGTSFPGNFLFTHPGPDLEFRELNQQCEAIEYYGGLVGQYQVASFQYQEIKIIVHVQFKVQGGLSLC